MHTLYEKLKHIGGKDLEIWLDTVELKKSGQVDSESLKRNVKQSLAVLVFLSEEYLTAEFCQTELRTAEEAGIPIIIVSIFIDLGIHPVHFAMIMSVNLTVGLATPPMGLVLFVASSVSGVKVETISKAILPFLAVEIFVIFLITYFPIISLGIPSWLGFVKDVDLVGPIAGFFLQPN